MTHMPARIVVAPNVWDLLLQQMRDENAALHAENGRLRAENERLHSEGSAKDAEIERQRAEIAVLRARLGRPKKTPRNSSVPPSQGAKPNAAANPPAEATHPRWGHPGAHRPLCEHPTVVKDMRAATCPHCAADLSGVAQSAGETYDHVEIPLAPAVTTRIILRARHLPVLPHGVQGGAAGGDGTAIAVRRELTGDGGASAAVSRRVL